MRSKPLLPMNRRRRQFWDERRGRLPTSHDLEFPRHDGGLIWLSRAEKEWARDPTLMYEYPTGLFFFFMAE
jgi:hypothetical protein